LNELLGALDQVWAMVVSCSQVVGAEPEIEGYRDRGGKEVGRCPAGPRDEIRGCACGEWIRRESYLMHKKNGDEREPPPLEEPNRDGAIGQCRERDCHELVSECSSEHEQDRWPQSNHYPHNSIEHCAPNA